MYLAELIIWIIATLLGGWSFSIALRLWDERRFAKRYPQSSFPRTGARWAGRAAAGSLGASLATGAIAVWFHHAFPAPSTSTLSVGHAIGIGTGLFAIGSWVIWAIGDPARGRRRCARCGYDMQDVPGRCCPECGREPMTEAGLLRTRRPRWLLASAFCMTLLCAASLLTAPRLARWGPVGLMPTWALMSGWRILPERFIDGADGSLTDRLWDDEITPERRRRFGERVLKTMTQSRAARDDQHIWAALNQCFDGARLNDVTLGWGLDNIRFDLPEQTDLDRIAELVLQDRVDRLGRHIDRPEYNGSIYGHDLKEIIDRWRLLGLVRDGEIPTDNRWPLFMLQDPVVTTRLNRDIRVDLPPGFETLLDSPHHEVRAECLLLLAQSSDPKHVIAAALQIGPISHESSIRELQVEMIRALGMVPPEDKEKALAILSEWIKSGTDGQASFALSLTKRQRHTVYTGTLAAEPPLRAAIIETTLAYRPTADGYDPRSHVSQWAFDRLCSLGGDPDEIFAAIAASASRRTPSAQIDLEVFGSEPGFIDAWMRHIAPLARHESWMVRQFVARSTPVRHGTEHDPRFDAILEMLQQDPEDQVRETAYAVWAERQQTRAQARRKQETVD